MFFFQNTWLMISYQQIKATVYLWLTNTRSTTAEVRRIITIAPKNVKDVKLKLHWHWMVRYSIPTWITCMNHRTILSRNQGNILRLNKIFNAKWNTINVVRRLEFFAAVGIYSSLLSFIITTILLRIFCYNNSNYTLCCAYIDLCNCVTKYLDLINYH